MTDAVNGDGTASRGAADRERELRELAIERIKKRRDFQTHLVVYLGVNGFLWAVWLAISLTSGWHFPWPVFPLFGWGIGVAVHAWDAYRGDITEEEIELEMARLRRA